VNKKVWFWNFFVFHWNNNELIFWIDILSCSFASCFVMFVRSKLLNSKWMGIILMHVKMIIIIFFCFTKSRSLNSKLMVTFGTWLVIFPWEHERIQTLLFCPYLRFIEASLVQWWF
jgi:membrane-associated HD superfamily phosphohydrolase